MCDSQNKSMKVHTRSSLPPDHPSCWGKWPSEALSTSGQADGFSSRAASAARGSFCSDGLTETLILPELCRFYCAGVAHLSGAGLRCRRHGQLCLGAEGLEKARSTARREHLGPGLEAAQARCPERHDATGARSWTVSVSKVWCAATRGCCECVKGTPYEAESRGAVCKGVSAVRRHAGGLYDAGSYCYTLVKCLKPFVRNGKGVIEANDHAQGSPINSEPLVMKRTDGNEKRAPKATASLSVFSLLSVSLFCFPLY
jgi:hypothetical protein